MVNLTQHLYTLSTPRPYSAATEHLFLFNAGSGTLSKPLLSFWLAQDRIYAAHTYPQLIGHLITSIPFSSLHPINGTQEENNQRILKCLSYSLQNIVREANLFKHISEKHELKIEEWKERKGTRDYTAEMIRIGALGRIEDGLVFLWAMERVYLDAWKFVKGRKIASASKNETSSAVNDLLDNWTNMEFEQFVQELADVVDSLEIKEGSEAWLRAEEIWARVIELEEAFWPDHNELASAQL